MATKMFCANCGAGYDGGVSYCPMCGVSTSPQFVRSFTRAPQAHCTVCGAQTGPRDTYCTSCGTECGEYIPGSVGGASVRLGGGGGSFAGGTKNLMPELSRAKEKDVFMPAIVFAVVAVAVGLILSLIVDMVFADTLKGTMSTLLSDAGISSRDSGLGLITVWLLSNLGGFFISATQGGQTGTISIAVGIVVLVAIPIASLIAARFARKAFIDSQHPGKRLTLIDTLLAAAIFAVINVILSLFPTPMGNAFKDSMSGATGVSFGARVIPLFIFSLLLAFIVSLPSIKESMNSIGGKNRAAGLSCAAGVSYLRDALLCGLVAAVVMLGYTMIKNGGEILGTGFKAGLLAMLPNLAVWGASFFSGGSLSITGFGSLIGIGDASIGALGLSLAGNNTAGVSWLGGLLLLVVGVWISITSVYRLLRNEQLDIPKIVGAVAVPAVLMFLVSMCATIGIAVNAPGVSESIAITSALFLNLVLCAVFMGAAVGAVYLAKKNPQLDNIIAKLATTPIVCGAAAVATLITCLTYSVRY